MDDSVLVVLCWSRKKQNNRFQIFTWIYKKHWIVSYLNNKQNKLIWFLYFKSVSVVNKSLFYKFLLYKHIQASKVKHTGGWIILKVSGFFNWGQLGNVHFRLFWFQHKKCSKAWVKCVYSDTESETWQLWLAFGKGKSFFSSSLCVAKVHGFTLIASTWLHNSKCEKWEDGGNSKGLDEGKKGADGISWMMSSGEQKIRSAAITYKHFIYFL